MDIKIMRWENARKVIGANAVVYQVCPGFYGCLADGSGDLPGVRVSWLSVALDCSDWLSPVYHDSPMDDNGYDIADYQAIAAIFRCMEDGQLTRS